ARGRLIDEKAVAEALWKNRLGAYCCDVLSHEPPTADNPILKAPHTVVTPHIAWATVEARERIIDILVGNIKAYSEGQPQNVVNS
ncbi:MAG: D-2-hydroxyacid dehydrogenase, partial [Bacteroidaceae bacterium]|nr:D-2-hydroxyacid dehydrogenase [Bacteroidaceae bacterium]